MPLDQFLYNCYAADLMLRSSSTTVSSFLTPPPDSQPHIAAHRHAVTVQPSPYNLPAAHIYWLA